MSEITFEEFQNKVVESGGLVYADKWECIENVVTGLGDEADRLLEEFEEGKIVEFVKMAGYDVLGNDELEAKMDEAREKAVEGAAPVCSWDTQGGGNMHKQPALEAIEEIVEKKGWQFLAELLEPHTLMCVNVAG